MKVRDIIESAASEFVSVMGAGAKWGDNIAGAGDLADPCGGPTGADTFIAAFSPEHVALMESVVEAANSYEWDEANESQDTALHRWEGAIRDANVALTAYRTERGLS